VRGAEDRNSRAHRERERGSCDGGSTDGMPPERGVLGELEVRVRDANTRDWMAWGQHLSRIGANSANSANAKHSSMDGEYGRKRKEDGGRNVGGFF
jgi:hypothetical protein